MKMAKKKTRQPGIEPGSHGWEPSILPLNHWRYYLVYFLFFLRTYRTSHPNLFIVLLAATMRKLETQDSLMIKDFENEISDILMRGRYWLVVAFIAI